jgi:hypothetical protein
VRCFEGGDFFHCTDAATAAGRRCMATPSQLRATFVAGGSGSPPASARRHIRHGSATDFAMGRTPFRWTVRRHASGPPPRISGPPPRSCVRRLQLRAATHMRASVATTHRLHLGAQMQGDAPQLGPQWLGQRLDMQVMRDISASIYG